VSDAARRNTASSAHGRRARAPIDLKGNRRFTTGQVQTLRRLLQTSGVLEPVTDRLHASSGRPRSLTVLAFIWATLVNGTQRHHQAHVVELARILNSLTADQLGILGVVAWSEHLSYGRVDRMFNDLCKALEDGWEAIVDGVPTWIDAEWYGNRLIGPSLANLPATSRSLAVDDTNIPTWGALHGEVWVDDLDPELEEGEEPITANDSPKRGRRKRHARLLGYGTDGRKIWTKDADARGGHRSATNTRAAGTYVGYELHLGVQTRDVLWSDGISEVSFGGDVPPVIKLFSLAPAGTHRGHAFVPTLLAAKALGQDIDDVIVDRGYSQLRPETLAHPLNRAAIHQTFRPMERQRKPLPFREDIKLIEGQPFSSHVPKELEGPLTMPPYGATDQECERYEEPFNRRARFRFVRHAGPDGEGTTRHRCPFHAGLLRSRQLPFTMRGSRSAPLVRLPNGAACCQGIVSISADELPLWQRLPAGTTAWRKSFHRRNVVEGANSGLKGGFVNIERKYFRVMGGVKMTVLLAPAIFGYNQDCVRSFLAKKAQEEQHEKTPRTRKKRLKGTWTQLLGVEEPTPGRGPPAG
jgi:hypothetical protein